eukprot:1116154-Rhodomonas_salina.2
MVSKRRTERVTMTMTMLLQMTMPLIMIGAGVCAGGAERVSPRRIGPCGWRCHAPCCRAWDVERNSRAPRAPDARGLVHGLQLLFGEEPGGCGFEESGGFGVCWSETVERGMHRPAPRGGSSARRLSFHVIPALFLLPDPNL